MRITNRPKRTNNFNNLKVRKIFINADLTPRQVNNGENVESS